MSGSYTEVNPFFNNLKKSQLIYPSDVKAAIPQNEDIIRYIERKNVSQTLQFTLYNLQENIHHNGVQ